MKNKTQIVSHLGRESNHWLPASPEHARLNTEQLFEQVQWRRLAIRNARQRIVRTSLVLSLLALVCGLGVYQKAALQQIVSSEGQPSTSLAGRFESELPDQASVTTLTQLENQLHLRQLLQDEQRELAKQQSQLTQLHVESKRLEKLRREQQRWIIREELSRTELLSISLHQRFVP
jgi:hypothetical protein